MKTIFTFSVDNAVDIITNSSSELFVMEGLSQEIVQEMIKSVYPGYLSEYDEVMHIDELSFEAFQSWFTSCFIDYWWSKPKKQLNVPDGFTFDEIYELDGETDRRTGEPLYKGRENFITEETYKSIINRFDPERNLWFLYSLDENPNWEHQERLETIATRYHLG